MSLDLPPDAAALRDRAVSPLLALLERDQIARDLDAIAAEMHVPDEPATKTIDELSPGEWVKVAGEWCEVMVIRPQILTVRREHSACEWEYHVTEGEAFAWHPAGF